MMTSGIAHISFPGGGFILSARTPYDRQIFIEHVLDRVHVMGELRVLLDDQRWLVRAQRSRPIIPCTHCGATVQLTCYSAASGLPFCMSCAFSSDRAPEFLGEDRSGQTR
jgi:hypothetical protein